MSQSIFRDEHSFDRCFEFRGFMLSSTLRLFAVEDNVRIGQVGKSMSVAICVITGVYMSTVPLTARMETIST